MSNFATPDLSAFYEALSAHVEDDAAHDGGADAMHRMLRDPNDPAAAPSPHVLNRIAAERVPEGAHVLDAGCGWGGTLFHLARHRGASGIGVTLSAVQQAKAAERAAALGLSDRVRILQGDYNTAEIAPAAFDRVVMIETVHHNRDPLATIERMRSLTARGGRILLVDDFARAGLAAEDPRAKAFVAGWRFSRFWSVEAFLTSLSEKGFSASLAQDLTPLYGPRGLVETEALIREADAEIKACGDDAPRRLALEALRGGYVLEQLYASGDAVYAMIEIEL